MKNASVRDLRYHFARIEGMLREGEEIEITKRKRVIARLIPTRPNAPAKHPDFLARLHEIYGPKKLKVSGAELLRQERSRLAQIRSSRSISNKPSSPAPKG